MKSPWELHWIVWKTESKYLICWDNLKSVLFVSPIQCVACVCVSGIQYGLHNEVRLCTIYRDMLLFCDDSVFFLSPIHMLFKYWTELPWLSVLLERLIQSQLPQERGTGIMGGFVQEPPSTLLTLPLFLPLHAPSLSGTLSSPSPINPGEKHTQVQRGVTLVAIITFSICLYKTSHSLSPLSPRLLWADTMPATVS